MKHYSIRNIYIDYDGIQCESYLEEHDLKVSVFWNYKWSQPVIHIPQAKGYPAVIHGLGRDLGWFSRFLECSRYE